VLWAIPFVEASSRPLTRETKWRLKETLGLPMREMRSLMEKEKADLEL
jgi:hypothetical protein